MSNHARHEVGRAVGGPVDEHGLPKAWRGTFLAASAAMCSDDIATARTLFEQIEVVFPENVQVRLYATWARARMAESLSDADFVELEGLARRNLGEHAAFALPLCVLAHAAARRGEVRMARRLFARAAEAEPSLVDARRGARRLRQWEGARR